MAHRNASSIDPILILGMHRSGTSLIAEAVDRWGAYGGEAGEMMPPAAENPRGFWEYLPLVKFNDQLLASLDSSWCVPPVDDRAVGSKIRDRRFRDKAQELIATMNRGKRVWYWKDPRLSILLPFWLNFFHSPTIIICLREPLEIAESLKARQRRQGDHLLEMPESASLLLWQVYTARIFSSIKRTGGTFVISYEEMIRNPIAQCRKLAKFLDDHYALNNQTKTAQMADVVEGALRRSRATASLNRSPIGSTPQKELAKFTTMRARRSSLRFHAERYPFCEGWRDYLRAVEEAGALSETGTLVLQKKIQELTEWAKREHDEAVTLREQLLQVPRVFRVLSRMGSMLAGGSRREKKEG